MNCLVCSKRAYSDYCVQHKPRKAIATRTALPQPKRRIKQRGDQYGRWMRTRKKWIKENDNLAYQCHYCGIHVYKADMTLDHRIPRSRAPELRYEFSNLVPCCFTCNGLKGSVDHDNYKHVCHT